MRKRKPITSAEFGVVREAQVLAKPFDPSAAGAMTAMTVVSAAPFKAGDTVYSDTHNDTIRSIVQSVNDDGTLTVIPKAFLKSQTAASGVPFTRHASNFKAK